MSFTLLILYFLFFSFLGWIIDSIASTIIQKQIINSGYFTELPLCPLYGVGGVVLFFLCKSMQSYPALLTVFIGATALNTIEYIGGIWCVVILKERLWDYSRLRWHLHGHIELTHALLWSALVVFFYYFLFPFFLSIDQILEILFVVPKQLDLLTLSVFLLGGTVFTYKRRKHRLSHLEKQQKKMRRYSR